MASEMKPILQEMLNRLKLEPQTIGRQMEQFEKDCTFLSSEYARLAERYDGEFVAVYQQQVRAHDSELNVVLQRLQDQGIDSGQTAIRRVSRRRLSRSESNRAKIA